MRIHLTQSVVNRAAVSDGKRREELCDTEIKGLYLEVRNTSLPGQGSWYLRYMGEGKTPGKRVTKHQKLGTTDSHTLKMARDSAKLLKAEILKGSDPRSEAIAKKEIPTLSRFYDEVYLPRIKLRNRSWTTANMNFNNRLRPKWGERRLDTITKAEAEEYLAELLKESIQPATADHVIKLLRNILNIAVSHEVIDRNKLSGISLMLVDNKVQRLLTEEELRRLIRVLKEDGSVASSVAMMALLTGARQGELLHATWSQIDRENRIWRIPSSNSKSKRGRTVPLTDEAMKLLDDLGTESVSEWLFVSPRKRNGQLVRLTTVQKRWRGDAKSIGLRDKAGLSDLRFHDLRHQYASILANNDVSIYQISKLLGHHSVTQTERYSHLGDRSMQNASAVVSNIVTAAIEEDEAA